MAALRGVLCAGAIATVALVGTAWAATPGGESSSGLRVVGPESLKLSVDAGKDQTEPVTVWLRNATRSVVHPKFSAQLEDTDKTPGDVVSVMPYNGASFRAVPAKAVQHYRLVLKGLDDTNSSTGQLVISADASKSRRASVPAPATVGVTVSPKRSYGKTYYWVLFAPAVLAAALVAIGRLSTTTRPALRSTITPANLSFSSGFASTLTIVGAVLGTVIAAGVLPSDTSHLADSAYKALNIIFGALIAAAVLIFSAFQKQTPGKDGSPELRSYVWAFMLACAVTAWAAFGELVTLWFLIWDINGTSGLTDAGVLVLDVLIACAGVAMAVYVLRRIGQVAGKPAAQPTPTPTITELLTGVTAAGLPLHAHPAMVHANLLIGADEEPQETGREQRGQEKLRTDRPVVMLAPQPPSRPPRWFVL